MSVTYEVIDSPDEIQTVSTKKPAKQRGRPSTGFDKKAYQREYMRKRREADKQKPALNEEDGLCGWRIA